MRSLLAIALVCASCAPIPAPTVQPFEDGNDWLVVAPITWKIGDTGQSITVPAGFVTDFASVPRALCTLLPSTDRYLKAAIVHDFLYWDQTCTKDEADALLFAAMIESKVPTWKRQAIYAGIRIGGLRAWQTNKQDRERGLIRVLPPASRTIPEEISWANYRQQLLAQKVVEPPYTRPTPAACAATRTLRRE